MDLRCPKQNLVNLFWYASATANFQSAIIAEYKKLFLKNAEKSKSFKISRVFHVLQCKISKLNVNIYLLDLFISLINISTTVHYLELRCDQIFGKKPTAIRGEIDIYLRATVLFYLNIQLNICLSKLVQHVEDFGYMTQKVDDLGFNYFYLSFEFSARTNVLNFGS